MESYHCRVQSANELDVKNVFDCQELTVILALNSAKLSHVEETSNRMFFCVVVPVVMCGSAAERPTHRNRRRHGPSAAGNGRLHSPRQSCAAVGAAGGRLQRL